MKMIEDQLKRWSLAKRGKLEYPENKRKLENRQTKPRVLSIKPKFPEISGLSQMERSVSVRSTGIFGTTSGPL